MNFLLLFPPPDVSTDRPGSCDRAPSSASALNKANSNKVRENGFAALDWYWKYCT